MYISQLVRLAQNNDSNAFAELYALTYKKTYNYARHYLRDDYLAQDALQDIYVNALKNLSKLNDPTLFIAWLNRISFNVCYDMSIKLRTNSAEISDPDIMEQITDTYIDANPEASALKNDEIKRIHDALEALPFLEEQVIVMRFFNDMKIDDVADTLDISRSTVKRYIASAKKNMKNYMKG
jgi:RNA polymerase sigma-70 factor (ECF subfamily)